MTGTMEHDARGAVELPAWCGLADALIHQAVAVQETLESDGGADSTTVEVATALVHRRREEFIASLGEVEPFSVLVHNAALSLPEAEVLAIAASVEADRRRQLLVGRLQHDIGVQRLTLDGLSRLLDDEHLGVRAVGPDASLRRAGLVELIDDGAWSSQLIRVHPSVMWALAGDGSSDPDLPVGTELMASSTESDDHDDPESGDARLVVVTGPDRRRRLDAAMRRCAGNRFVVVTNPDDEHRWVAVVREATITGSGVVVELDGELPPAGRRHIARASHLSWVVSSATELPIEQLPDRPWVEVHAVYSEVTDAEWEAAMGDAPRAHRLRPEQLRLVGRAHQATGDVDAAVRRLAGGHVDRVAQRIRPRRTWDDLVLSDDRLELLRDLVARARHGATVYDEWGFSPLPSRGVVALFSGPSGTGKTLAAEIVAGELGLDMYKLELSAVVSKYIGETEKNLDRLFDAAGAGNVVLFFDEADALFGKRSEVRDARDRYANIEVSYLLQRLEAHDGVVVLATNFERNIDDAFLRRIQTRVSFALPEETERKSLWELNLPASAPVAPDVDTGLLAATFEMSGAAIRNAAIQAAFVAAADEASIDMERVLASVQREYQKLGRLLNVDLENLRR